MRFFSYGHFNPRSLVGNDVDRVYCVAVKCISIHVPSWGTTIVLTIFFPSTTYFNPRSLVGNDRCTPPYHRSRNYFNPRSLVGNDLSSFQTYALILISIHVPSWGTTYDQSQRGTFWTFQSTFPRGERPLLELNQHRLRHFNPRSLVGNDRVDRDQFSVIKDFNPRSLVGNDQLPPTRATAGSRFQSTFPRGERRCPLHVMSRMTLFQSTFPRGERQDRNSRCRDTQDFNPRSLVGNDGKFSQIFFVFLCNKYNFSTFYYPFSLFFSVIHVTFLIFVVRILPAFYVYF